MFSLIVVYESWRFYFSMAKQDSLRAREAIWNVKFQQCFKNVLCVCAMFVKWSVARRSNIVGQTFEIFKSSKIFVRSAMSRNITLIVKQFRFVSSRKYFVNYLKNIVQQIKLILLAKQCLLCYTAKRSNIACKAIFKCLTNNVWSFG